MTNERYEFIKSALEKFDNNSEDGSWTYNTLTLIQNNPKIDVTELADVTGNKADSLRSRISYLLDLGLVFTHKVGFSLSPLGKDFLTRLSDNN